MVMWDPLENNHVYVYIYIYTLEGNHHEKKVFFLDDDKPLRPIKHGD